MIDQSIGVRLSSALHAELAAAGRPSAVARALVVLGLATAGRDVGAYREDVRIALASIADPALAASLAALLNAGSTPVQHTFNTPPDPSPAFQPADEGDPFAVVIEV
jgi:hypothetical protein